MTLLFFLGLTWCTASVYGLIPPSNFCYQNAIISSACEYGNLNITAVGRTFTPKDCNSQMDIKYLEHPPFVSINSTNSTERFTVLMVDMGPQGRGPGYLHWMVTNVSISTPNYQTIPPNNILASYQKPLLMHGLPQPTLIRILVFRHGNILRIPFGELWVTRKRDFSLSQLFSNTSPNLRLCGPVAGIQFWVYDQSSLTPSAPQPPHPPAYIPVVPVVPVQHAPAGMAPGQTGYVPAQGYPAVQQPTNHHPHVSYPKKSAATTNYPMLLTFVPILLLSALYI